MRKQGYTLAEILVAIGIVGVIAALMLPVFNKIQPDQEKAMYLKAYRALNTAVTAIAADKTIYPVYGENGDTNDYSENPLYNTRAVKSPDRGIDIPEGNEKFGRALAWAFNGTLNQNYDADTSYTGAANSNFVPTFTVQNGMQFMVTTAINIANANAPSYSSEIWVDLDGVNKGRNCSIRTCATPDRFKFVVAANGAMTPADAKGRQYIGSQQNLRKLSNIAAPAVGENSITSTETALREVKRSNTAADNKFKDVNQARSSNSKVHTSKEADDLNEGTNSDGRKIDIQRLTCEELGLCGDEPTPPIEPPPPPPPPCEGNDCNKPNLETDCSVHWVYQDYGYVVTDSNMVDGHPFLLSPIVAPLTTPANGRDRFTLYVQELYNMGLETREEQREYIVLKTYNDDTPESHWPDYTVYFDGNEKADQYRREFGMDVTIVALACPAADSYCTEENAYAMTTRTLSLPPYNSFENSFDNEIVTRNGTSDGVLPNELPIENICTYYGEIDNIAYSGFDESDNSGTGSSGTGSSSSNNSGTGSSGTGSSSSNDSGTGSSGTGSSGSAPDNGDFDGSDDNVAPKDDIQRPITGLKHDELTQLDFEKSDVVVNTGSSSSGSSTSSSGTSSSGTSSSGSGASVGGVGSFVPDRGANSDKHLQQFYNSRPTTDDVSSSYW